MAATLPDLTGARTRARGWLHFCRGQLLVFSDNAQALRALDEGEPLALAVGDRALVAYIRITRGEIRCLGGAIRRGMVEMERGVAALDTLPNEYRLRPGLDVGLAMLPTLLADGEGAAPLATSAPTGPTVTMSRRTLIVWLAHTGRYREALVQGEAFIAALAAVPGNDQLAQGATAQLGFGHAHAALGRPIEARRAFARSRVGHAALGDAHMVGFTLWSELLLAVLPYQADDVAERSRLAAESARAWERARGTITDTPHGDPTDLLLALVEGRWAAAERVARATLVAATAGHAHGAIVALGVLARHQGDLAASWARVRELHPSGPATEPGDCYFHHGIALQALAADLALDAADPATAEQWIAAHGRWLAWSGAVLWQADHQRLRARLAAASGDRSAAGAHAEAALARAAAPRQPLALLAAHRLLGELDTTDERYADAQARLAAALALADACAAPYERALTLLALAALHVAGASPEDVSAPLAEARAILTALAAAPALARADAVAYGAVARGTHRVPTGYPPQWVMGDGSGRAGQRAAVALPFGLTTREAEVLRLVAQGLPDAQVAACLSLSRRTVHAHLRTIYGKLGLVSRSAATRFALEHGLA